MSWAGALARRGGTIGGSSRESGFLAVQSLAVPDPWCTLLRACTGAFCGRRRDGAGRRPCRASRESVEHDSRGRRVQRVPGVWLPRPICALGLRTRNTHLARCLPSLAAHAPPARRLTCGRVRGSRAAPLAPTCVEASGTRRSLVAEEFRTCRGGVFRSCHSLRRNFEEGDRAHRGEGELRSELRGVLGALRPVDRWSCPTNRVHL